MSLNNQEKFVNSFWVIILLVAVGIYFWVIPKNSIAEAYSKKKHYNLKKTSRFLAVGFWIIAISCVPVLISLWFDTPWICIICVILLVLGTSVLHDYENDIFPDLSGWKNNRDSFDAYRTCICYIIFDIFGL